MTKKYKALLKKLKVELELYERYVDDQDVIVRSIGRRVKFCPEAGVMISKSQQEIESEKDKNKDELFMAELLGKG